jgi:flagellar protein FliO/FliZ
VFSTNPVLSTLLALGLTLALIWLAARLLRVLSPMLSPKLLRPGAPRTSSGSAILTLESVTPIAPRRRVIVLRYGEQRLAVLTGGPQDVSLGWLPPPTSPSP